MESQDWIFSGPKNGLFVRLEGETIPLRFTVFQQEAYVVFLTEAKKEAEKAKPADVIETIKSMKIDSLTVAEIALNPVEGKLEYPKDRIVKILDLDQVRILVSEWLERKVFNPQAKRTSDPLLPVEAGPQK